MSRALLYSILPVCLTFVQCTPRPSALAVNIHVGQPPGPPLKKGDRIDRTGIITFSAHNQTNAHGWLMSFLVDSAQHIFWLQPLATPEAQSVRVPPHTQQPVSLGPVTLEASAKGPAQLVMFFSEAPLPAMGVNEQVRMGGYQAVRGIEGVTQVSTFPLVLD